MAGETTTVAASAARGIRRIYDAGMVPIPFSIAYTTGMLENTDVAEAGYLPPDVTLYGFIVKATDMDSNGSPALAQKITVGATDLVTGITVGQTGGADFFACTPTAITAVTKVIVTNTAASATAVAGTLYVTALVAAT